MYPNNTNTYTVHMNVDVYEMGDVAQWLERQSCNPKTLGSIPWRRRVRDSESTLVCAWPPFVCTACTQMCVHVKDPISICRKRVGFTAGGMYGHTQVLHTLG